MLGVLAVRVVGVAAPRFVVVARLAPLPHAPIAMLAINAATHPHRAIETSRGESPVEDIGFDVPSSRGPAVPHD
jgi:hypothetical protein